MDRLDELRKGQSSPDNGSGVQESAGDMRSDLEAGPSTSGATRTAVRTGTGRSLGEPGAVGDASKSDTVFDRMENGLARLQHRFLRGIPGSSRRGAQRTGDASGAAESSEAGEASESSTQLNTFYEKVDMVKAQIADLVAETEQIRAAHRARLEDPTRMQPPPDMRRARMLAIDIKRQLDEMKLEEQKKASQTRGQASSSAQARIIGGTHAALSRRFLSALKDFQQLQGECDSELREQAERELRIMNPDITHEQATAILEAAGSSGNAGELMRQQMLQATDRDYEQIRIVARDMEERAAALRELESGMEELRNIFLDMSVLVESQGETLDEIEKNIAAAKVSTKRGTRKLQTARKRQRTYYRLMFCGFYCLIILLVVILVPVLVTTLRTSTSTGG
jgi:syntaxin 1B/2/3